MMKRFSRRRRGTTEGKAKLIDAAEWLPKILESGIVEAKSLEIWADSGVPDATAAIGRGERADGTKIIVAFSPKSATDAVLGGLSAAQHAVETTQFSGELVVVATQWSAGARRLLGLLGRMPYAVESIEVPSLGGGRAVITADPPTRVLAADAAQIASRLTSIESRTAFTRAAVALEGLAAKHGGSMRVGIDRLELVVLARRVAEIRIDGESALLEIQIGGRSTTPLVGADLASAFDGLEGQIRRRLNDRKVREGEEGLRGRVVSQLAGGSELRSLSPWPVPGADLAVVDAVGVNAAGDPVVVTIREEVEWATLGAVLEGIGPLASLFPVLFKNTPPPLQIGVPRLLFVAERFAPGLERALAGITIAYELRKVSEASGSSINLVSSGSGEGARSKAPRRGRRRGGRSRSGTNDEAASEDTPPSGPAADTVGSDENSKRGPRSESSVAGAAGDQDSGDPGEGVRSRRRRRSRRGRSGTADRSVENSARGGHDREEGRGADSASAGRTRFEEVSLMDLDDVPGVSGTSDGRDDTEPATSNDDSASDSGSSRRSHRRGRRGGGRGDSRKGRNAGGPSRQDGDAEAPDRAELGSRDSQDDVEANPEDYLVDADDLSEILARLMDDDADFEAGVSTEESYEDAEDIDEDEPQSARRRDRDRQRQSQKNDGLDRPVPRGRAAILVHADRDSLLSATLLARDIRQLEGMWIYPQAELMTFFRSIATDLRDDTPIYVVGFLPSPARDVIQAAALYRGRLTWFGRQAWPPEDRVALCESLGSDAIHGGEGLDSVLPLVLGTCTRRSRFSDKLVDLVTGRFTQHDFERWGRLWRWRAGQIIQKTGDIRSDVAGLLAGRPSDLAKEAALVELPPAPAEVAWVAEHDFRLVHFGGHVMVILEVDASVDVHLCARIARERYSATLSLAHAIDEETFIFGGDEVNGKRALDYLAVTEHLANKLEWVKARPDDDHVSRFQVRDLARHPERLEEIIGEIAMGRSLLER